jgi:hypothetical protein
MFLDTRRPGWPAPCFCRFELGFAKIRINDQRCRWTPAGLVGRLRVFVDSNLAAPGFELTTSDVAGHPPAWLADSVFLSIRTWLRQDSN